MSKTPNKTLYEQLRQSNKGTADCILVLETDATWHIYRHLSKEEQDNDFISPTGKITEVWRGWEDMLKRTTRKALETLHFSIFQIPAPKKMTDESLCILIWNYRCYNALDHRIPQDPPVNQVKNPLQRHSSIANRVYSILEPSADAKKFTSPAGLACLAIIKQCCEANGGVCTEGQLKPMIMENAAKITPKTDSAWRFLQFYRPQLVEAELIAYKK